MPAGQWFRAPRRLPLLFLAIAVVPAVALLWLGWRLLEQEPDSGRRGNRKMWGLNWLEQFGWDLRFAIRTLFRNRGFMVVAVVSLAIGIGADTTIFSVINTVLFRPLPFKNPGRLVTLYETDGQGRRQSPTHELFVQWNAQSAAFEAMAYFTSETRPISLSTGREAVRTTYQRMHLNLFPLLGVEPALGRGFLKEDLNGGQKSSTVILSHRLWQSQFGGREDILGKTYRFDGESLTVIGVMPAGFWVTPWTSNVGLWRCIDITLTPQSRWPTKIGRLKAGVSPEQAQAELATINRRVENVISTPPGKGATVINLRDEYFGGMDRMLYTLLGAVSFVLLIAIANIANLLLARGKARFREISIRAAVGADRARLVRQLVTEGVPLVLLGGVGGLLFACWGIRIFVALTPEWFPESDQISIDGRVLLFTFGLSVLSGILAGLMPALRVSGINLNETLKAGGMESLGSGRRRRSTWLLVSEVALATTLLLGAGTMIKSFLGSLYTDFGYDPDNLLTTQFVLGGGRYWLETSNDRKRVTPLVEEYYQQVLERARRLPGVENAGISSAPAPGWGGYQQFEIEGRRAEAGRPNFAAIYEVDDGLFKALKLPLIRGRYLSDRDTGSSPWVVVISQSMVQTYFPDENPLGQSIELVWGGRDGHPLEPGPPREIVGVVSDVKVAGLARKAPPSLYVSYRQHPWEYPGGEHWSHVSKTLVIRTTGNPLNLAEPVQKAVADIDKDQALFEVMTMRQRLADSLSGRRFYMWLFGIFGGLALVLAAVGIYGVQSYLVTTRTREFGIRMAVGADKAGLIRQVLRETMRPVAIGISVGLFGGYALGKLLSARLFGVNPIDVPVIVAVAALMAGVAMLASYVPGRRAARVDPASVLRWE